MIKFKKLSTLLLVSALLMLPTSASAANLYGVVSNKWDGNGTIQEAVDIDGDTIFVGNSTDLAVLSTESGGSMVSHEKNKPSFPTKGIVKHLMVTFYCGYIRKMESCRFICRFS